MKVAFNRDEDTGILWREVTNPYPTGRTGRTLTDEEINEILEMRKAGYSTNTIAVKFKIGCDRLTRMLATNPNNPTATSVLVTTWDQNVGDET